jgi:outer membrane protein assembly factor BamB
MMRFAFSLPLLLIVSLAIQAADWPGFRGPGGRGTYNGPELPIEWGPDKNVAWKQTIPGKGWSSPVVWKGRVYLTTAVPAQPGDARGDQSLRALCLNAKDGTIVWNVEVFQQEAAKSPPVHSKNSHASPTPLTDGERLYVHFGHQGTAALTLDGQVAWRNTELKYAPVHGNGGSPVLAGGRLIFSADGSDQQAVVGLEPKTGKVVWRTDRESQAGKKFSFSTPLVFNEGGREVVISPASEFFAAYEARSGKELWRVPYGNTGYSVIPQPAVGHGMIFLSTGYDSPVLLAVKLENGHEIAWSQKKGAPHTPSLLLVGDELYSLSDRGMLTCLDAVSGKVHWSERVPGAYSASPICANGKIYITNETGAGMVAAAGTEFKELARSDLKEKTFATFVPVDGALFVRTETQLYRFEKK